jgi:hypothetical protein
MTKLPAIRNRGELLDARLHLLDRQLLNDDDAPVGIVDDIVLDGVQMDEDIAEGADAPRATALLSGQVVVTRIFGGFPPVQRLQEIPWKLVACVGVVVRLKPNDMTFDADWIERWLRDRVVKHIPGGRDAAE